MSCSCTVFAEKMLCHQTMMPSSTASEPVCVKAYKIKIAGSSIINKVIGHNFIETVSTNNISVQRVDGAGSDNGLKKKKKH